MLKAFILHLQFLWYGLLVCLIGIMFGLSFFNSDSLAMVGIKLKEGQKEHSDKTIPFLSDPEEKLPDYKLDYLSEDEWHVIGTTVNRSASDWIDFKISDPPNLTLVQGIRISDEDSMEHDLLEEVQLVDTVPEGEKFEYRIETRRSLKAGMAWFASTSLGTVIFTAIGVAVFLVVMSHISF